MKLYLTATNEKGKQAKLGGNEYLDLDIRVGNDLLARLTLREDEEGLFKLFDENDTEIKCREPRPIDTGNKQKGKKCSIKDCETIRKIDGTERYFNGRIVCDRHAYEIDK